MLNLFSLPLQVLILFKMQLKSTVRQLRSRQRQDKTKKSERFQASKPSPHDRIGLN